MKSNLIQQSWEESFTLERKVDYFKPGFLKSFASSKKVIWKVRSAFKNNSVEKEEKL